MYDTTSKTEPQTLTIDREDMAHLSRTSWGPNDDWFVMSWINRDTTRSIVYACKGANWDCTKVQTQTSNTGWIGFKGRCKHLEYTRDFYFLGPFYPYALEQFGEYFTIESRRQDFDNSRIEDGYWRVAQVKFDQIAATTTKQFHPYRHENPYVVYDNRVDKVLSFGPSASEVQIIIFKYNNNNYFKNYVFYTLAAPEPSQRHLFTSIGEHKELCITCSLIDTEMDVMNNSR